VKAFYIEATVEKAVPGSNFVPLSFDGGRFALQDTPVSLNGDSPVALVGVRRIEFTVTDLEPRDNTRPLGLKDAPLSVRGSQNHISEGRIKVVSSGEHLSVRRRGDGVSFVDDNTGWPTEESLEESDKKKGKKVMCLVVHSGIAGGETTYMAYVAIGPEDKGAQIKWRHQATVRVACGRPFEDFTSCIEDVRRDGASAEEERRANFGPAWFLTGTTGNYTWKSAEAAMFTSSDEPTERPDAVHTKAVPASGSRQIATGGDMQENSVRKLKKEFATKLPAGQKGDRPTSLPDIPELK
jgi:hypothetical protein